jgi:hypothetical protein
MFIYFYNKFRPVNRMHYIKCGVIEVAAAGLWHLGSLFISRQTVFTVGAI